MDGTAARDSLDVLIQPPPGAGVVAASLVEMPPITLCFEMRQESGDSFSDIALNAQTETTTATQVVSSDIHLNGGLSLRVPVAIREVRSEHQEQVAGLQRAVAGSETDQAGHTDVVRVVVLDEFLASQGVNDGCLEGIGELHERVVGTCASSADQYCYPGSGIPVDL